MSQVPVSTDADHDSLPENISTDRSLLTQEEFQRLADVPPEAEWFANIQNANTRRAYRNDLRQFMTFVGIAGPGEFRKITRAHVIAWRKRLEARSLAPASVRRKLAALAALFDFLCDRNAITHNPVKGVARPKEGTQEGRTPAISDAPRPSDCSTRLRPRRSRVGATGPSSRSCSITRCVALNFARCALRITRNDAASRRCGFTAKAENSVTCPFIPRPWRCWKNTSMWPVIAST